MNAMILAAGLGLRMRPLTNVTPKPLLEVDGITMIDRMLAHLKEGGIKTVVINTHYMAERLRLTSENKLELTYNSCTKHNSLTQEGE